MRQDGTPIVSAHLPYIAIAIVVTGGLLFLFLVLQGSRSEPVAGARAAHAPEEFPALFADPLLADLPDPGGSKPDSQIHVPPPPFSAGVFPCSECHDEDLPANPKVRKLKKAHEELVLEHGGENRWCYDCHNPTERDKLRLANGAPVGFEESYRLCGQCHGEIYRDWREGIHGRRVGNWDGEKRYLLCAHCHNPHSPRFKPVAPLPPPVRPDFLRR